MTQLYTISQKRAFGKDPWSYHARYYRLLVPKYVPRPLDFGIAFHHAMHRLHKVSQSKEGGFVQPLDAKWAGPISSYLSWHFDKDDLEVLDAEIPFEVPMFMWSDRFISTYAGGTYAGVLDSLVKQKVDGTLWVNDYKTHEKFHDFNPLYDAEQLGLYVYAMRTLGHSVKGGIITSVRIRYTADKKPSVVTGSKQKLKRTTKTGVKVVSKSNSIPRNVKVQDHRTFTPEGYLESDFVWTKILDPEASEGAAPKYVNRKLVITRLYYVFSDLELQNIVRDFTSWMEAEQQMNVYYRNPQAWSKDDPYTVLSLMERRGQDTTQYIQEHFDVKPPHGEIRWAKMLHDLPLEKWPVDRIE